MHSNELTTEEVDLDQYPNAKILVDRCRDFFEEVEDLTPGGQLESFLNTNYGPGNAYYEDFCKYVKLGLDEGWLANIEMDGRKYRRSKIRLPHADTRYFSLTAVYMESQEEYSGQYHKHPYGEINCVVQLDETAELMGFQGWRRAGWTSPAPGTHHYPQVRGGALVALFFLPAGRKSQVTDKMLNIAVAGAGPVGCTFARLILTSPISSQINLTIFEKDASRTARTSLGGTLDLHPKTGLAAIEAMDLMDSFKRYARYEGEEMRMCDQNGLVYIHMKEAPKIEGFDARPEIDREKLMDVLLQGVLDLAPDVVKWGKAVSKVKQSGERWTVELDDGTEQGPFDLVVGADGAWSKIRDVLTDVKPKYSGICTIAATVDEKSAGQDWEKISNMVGTGNNFSYSYGQSAMLQRMGNGSLKSSFNAKRDLEWVEELRNKDDEAIRQILHEKYKDWVPDFHLWIEASKKFWCAPLYELPVGHRWNHRKGVTCIGDSAHLMTPFAGEGVNAGMRDALDLFGSVKEALLENGDIDPAVQKFEESMFVRAAEFMKDTERNKNGMHAWDAPYGFFADMMGVVVREISGFDVSQGWRALVWLPVRCLAYTYFWSRGTYGAIRRRVVRI